MPERIRSKKNKTGQEKHYEKRIQKMYCFKKSTGWVTYFILDEKFNYCSITLTIHYTSCRDSQLEGQVGPSGVGSEIFFACLSKLSNLYLIENNADNVH